MPSCELWLWLLSLCVNMSEGRFWFVFGFKTSVGWHRLLVPANLELRDLFNSVITFLLRTMTSSPFSVWLICLSSISSMSFSLISEISEMTFCYQNCSDLKKSFSDWEKLLKFKGCRLRICNIFEITRTIYSNSERSEQFLVTESFFNLFLEVSYI